MNTTVEHKGAIALLSINRPEKMNALNAATIAELSHQLDSLNDDKSVRAIVLTGTGDKAFVAGADISEFAAFTAEEGKELARRGQEELFNKVENMRKPMIAAINGFALGGGLELAMSCHFRYASEKAKMGLPEVGLGVIPGYGGTQRLAMLVGKGRAMELILSAQMINAEQAMEIGLINKICVPGELINECIIIAEKCAAQSSTALALTIEAVNAGMMDRKMGYETEINNFGRAFATHDFKEGTTAFLEKRKPTFE